MRPSPRYDHVYAILRYETTAGPDVPIEVKVTVKKIVTDPQVAKEEVERLNHLNRDKGCYYFSQVTRIEKGSEVLASSAPQEEGVGKPSDR
jgi:hypothetical protein